MARDVVLAPGLWMPGAAMTLLASRLARAGYFPHVFTYRGRSPLEGNVARFARFVRESLDGRAAHFVGHSLGGVLILETLNARPELPVASAILLGAPVRGCFAGRRFGTARLGRWMMGACGELWQEREAVWKRDAPLGVLAGTVPLGLGRAFGRLPGPNDGVVRVEETTVDGMAARALVAAGHSVLIVSPAVGRQIERFMREGRFQ
ncbi:MAG TPA: alpha/beta fold hydrolase [Burkholderiales bacterium]|nr:alpha/beta fold hydrolase [Burkholderiales bacterium]